SKGRCASCAVRSRLSSFNKICGKAGGTMSEHNVHRQHRERVKSRFLAEGMDHMPPHNALELLLFYAIPQGDVNGLAHRLIERFGSYSAVIDAPYEQLLEVDGIGPHAATLLKLLPASAR